MVLALGLIACDRNDLTSGPALQNDAGGPPEPSGPPGLPGDVELRINELMVENTNTLQDENGDFPPWFEIHNLSDLELNLAGLFVSDDLLESEKWAIPDIPEAVIEPFGFLIIFTDGDEDNPDDLHANFTLARGPFTRVIFDGGRLDVVSVDTTSLPADRTMGRFPDGQRGTLQLLEEPTPGEPNSPPAEGPPPPQEAEFVRGDVTEDDLVTVTDMVGIQLILAGEQPLPDCEDRADANDDGVVDEGDPVAVGNAVFREVPLPAPYPAPGIDPTPDDLTCEAP